MLNSRENTRIINLDSILLLSIIFLGLLIFNGTTRNNDERNRNPVSACITISLSSAVSSPGIRLLIFQKTWILNKDNFDLLAFNRNPLFEDKKTGLKISCYKNIRRNIGSISAFIFYYHLFPSEIDELPLLS